MPSQVRLLPFAIAVEVHEHESVLAAVLRTGYHVHHGCRSGRCGACAAQVVSGRLECPSVEGGFVLGREALAAGRVLLCQSFPATAAVEVDIADMQLTAEELTGGLDTWPARIVQAEASAPEVRLVTLQTQGAPRRWRAGAHVAIEVPGGAGECRSYSLLDLPRPDGRFRLLVRVLPGGRFSPRLDALAAAGETLRVRGPLGRFALRPGHWPAVLIAGGTGIAPLRAFIEELAASRSRRPVRLLYGARTREELVLLPELQALAQDLPQLAIETLCEQDGERGTGTVAELIDRQIEGADVYLCGPAAMVAACHDRLAALGVTPRRLTSESFVPSV